MSFSIPTLRAYRIITGGAGYDYSTYCSTLNSGTAGCPYWGADILINGNSYACANITPDITGGSATITYTINSTLQQFMIDNPDVTVTYQNHMECEDGPANVYDSAVTSFTNGATAVLTRNCSSGPALVTITLTISTPTNRQLFYDSCCVPYGLICGPITQLQAVFSFNLDA
jgi:hypothetical protein